MCNHTTNHVFLIPSVNPKETNFWFVEAPSYHDVMQNNFVELKRITPTELFKILESFNHECDYYDESCDGVRIEIKENINPNYINLIFRSYNRNKSRWEGIVSVTTYRIAFVNAMRVALTNYIQYNSFTNEEQDLMDFDWCEDFYALPITSQMIDDTLFGSNE
mgnify:FL=1